MLSFELVASIPKLTLGELVFKRLQARLGPNERVSQQTVEFVCGEHEHSYDYHAIVGGVVVEYTDASGTHHRSVFNV